MGKLNTTNLTPKITDKLDSFETIWHGLYVDANNGNDNNDGFTPQTPFKTFRPVEKLLNRKKIMVVGDSISESPDIIKIKVSNGIYDYVEFIDSPHTRISLIGESENGVIFNGMNETNTTIKVWNVAEFFTTNITINTPIKLDRDVYVAIEHIRAPGYHSNLVIDNSKIEANVNLCVGLNVSHSVVVVDHGSRFIGKGFPFRATLSSNLTLENCSIEQPNATCLVETGSIISYNESYIKNIPQINIDSNSTSLVLNKVNTGIIVEKGSNENGEYIKFADGRLECYHNIQTMTEINADSNVLWTFPAKFTHNEINGFVDLFVNLKMTTQNHLALTDIKIMYTQNNAGGQAIITCDSTANQSVVFNVMALGRWK